MQRKREEPYLVHHHEHDGLGDHVSHILADYPEVRVHEVADGLNLSLQLRVNGAKLWVLDKRGRGEEEVRPQSPSSHSLVSLFSLWKS